MNRLMLSTLDDYARTGSFSSSEDIRDFLSLFEDVESTCVFNDTLGTPGFKQMTTPVSYTRSIRSDKGSMLSFEIRNVRKRGDFYQEGGKWHRRISLGKEILYIDSSVYSGEAGGDLAYLGASSGGWPRHSWLHRRVQPSVERQSCPGHAEAGGCHGVWPAHGAVV